MQCHVFWLKQAIIGQRLVCHEISSIQWTGDILVTVEVFFFFFFFTWATFHKRLATELMFAIISKSVRVTNQATSLYGTLTSEKIVAEHYTWTKSQQTDKQLPYALAFTNVSFAKHLHTEEKEKVKKLRTS